MNFKKIFGAIVNECSYHFHEHSYKHNLYAKHYTYSVLGKHLFSKKDQNTKGSMTTSYIQKSALHYWVILRVVSLGIVCKLRFQYQVNLSNIPSPEIIRKPSIFWWFQGKRKFINLLNVRSEIWWQSLKVNPINWRIWNRQSSLE